MSFSFGRFSFEICQFANRIKSTKTTYVPPSINRSWFQFITNLILITLTNVIVIVKNERGIKLMIRHNCKWIQERRFMISFPQMILQIKWREMTIRLFNISTHNFHVTTQQLRNCNLISRIFRSSSHASMQIISASQSMVYWWSHPYFGRIRAVLGPLKIRINLPNG